MTTSTATPNSASSLDRLVQAWQARFTDGLSPASLQLAYLDWLVHLSNTPGKQARLLEQAWRNVLQLSGYAMRCTDPCTPPCVECRPQDQRFVGTAWQDWIGIGKGRPWQEGFALREPRQTGSDDTSSITHRQLLLLHNVLTRLIVLKTAQEHKSQYDERVGDKTHSMFTPSTSGEVAR